MSNLSFVLWTIARCSVTVYMLLEVGDYLSMLIQRQVNGIVVRSTLSFQTTVLLGVAHGVIFFAGAIVGGVRGNFLGMLLLLLLMVIGAVLGTVCQWATPLRSLVKGGDR